jgi:hypothetical protein
VDLDLHGSTAHTDPVVARVRSFAAHVGELGDAGWKPSPAVALPSEVVLQTHCHKYSVFGGTVQR